MDYLTWRHVFFLLLTLVVAQSIIQYVVRSGRNTEAVNALDAADPRLEQRPGSHGGPVRPAVNTDVCRDDYRNLYHELDRAIAFWKTTNRTISRRDVRISSKRGALVTILVQNNEVRVLHTQRVVKNKEYRARTIAVLGLIERALWAATVTNEHLPTIEATIAVGDTTDLDGGSALDEGSVWIFAADVHNERHKQHWLIPHYGLYSTPAMGSFEDMRREAQQYDALFVNKIPKLGVECADDIFNNGNFETIQVPDLVAESSMAMGDLCEHAFTLDCEGHGHSASLFSLLNCNSLLLKTASNWTTHLHHLLVPEGREQNHVSIKHDFADLENNMRYYLAHPEKAQHIIQNAVDTFRSRYTTSSATSCYIRRLINSYSTVSYTPEVRWRSADGVSGVIRGISFVDFVILDNDYDEDNIYTSGDFSDRRKQVPLQAMQHPFAAE